MLDAYLSMIEEQKSGFFQNFFMQLEFSQYNFEEMLSIAMPVVLGIFGTILAINVGIRFFRNITK